MRPRFFASSLDPAQRRVYGGAALWFVIVSAAMVWPIYVPLARIRPMILGVPFGLIWLAVLMAASFGVALALFRWELRRGLIDASAEDEAASVPGTRES